MMKCENLPINSPAKRPTGGEPLNGRSWFMMNRSTRWPGLLFALCYLSSLYLSGCGVPNTPMPSSGTTTPIAETLAQLSAEDRPSATAQKLCAVSEEPLGSMGVPIKLTIDGQTVWICCQHCEKEAKAHPQETIERAQRLRGTASLPTP
jgi:hypothetical protein